MVTAPTGGQSLRCPVEAFLLLSIDGCVLSIKSHLQKKIKLKKGSSSEIQSILGHWITPNVLMDKSSAHSKCVFGESFDCRWIGSVLCAALQRKDADPERSDWLFILEVSGAQVRTIIKQVRRRDTGERNHAATVTVGEQRQTESRYFHWVNGSRALVLMVVLEMCRLLFGHSFIFTPQTLKAA